MVKRIARPSTSKATGSKKTAEEVAEEIREDQPPDDEEKNDKDSDENHDSEESEEYAVEKIVKSRVNKKGVTEYFVKWYNYSKSENTWEPEENLSCPELLEEFKKTQETKAKKRKATEKVKSSVNRKNDQLGGTTGDNSDNGEYSKKETVNDLDDEGRWLREQASGRSTSKNKAPVSRKLFWDDDVESNGSVDAGKEATDGQNGAKEQKETKRVYDDKMEKDDKIEANGPGNIEMGVRSEEGNGSTVDAAKGKANTTKLNSLETTSKVLSSRKRASSVSVDNPNKTQTQKPKEDCFIPLKIVGVKRHHEGDNEIMMYDVEVMHLDSLWQVKKERLVQSWSSYRLFLAAPRLMVEYFENQVPDEPDAEAIEVPLANDASEENHIDEPYAVANGVGDDGSDNNGNVDYGLLMM